MDPTTPKERIRSLDIVRGFALIGVFLINWQAVISWSDVDGTANSATQWVLQNVVAGKFYRLFAFLFGIGFVLQMRRLEARGAPLLRIYSRRLAVLFIIGLAHGMLLWPNDILALFAQFGVLLLLVRKMSNGGLLIVGLLCLVAAPMRYYIQTDFADFLSPATAPQIDAANPAAAAPDPDEPEPVDLDWLRREGSYGDFRAWTSSYFLNWQMSLATRLQMLREEFLMFLLGLWAGRSGLFDGREERLHWTRQAFAAALVSGIVTHVMAGWLDARSEASVYGHLAVTFRQIARALRPAAFSLAYGLGVLHIVERFDLQQILAPVGSVGRMALTNYLLLSVMVILTFYSFGLGLYGGVTVVGGVAMATASYALTAVASSWWLARYRFGPAEWLWRSLTYGSWQPLKKGWSGLRSLT